MIGDIISTVWRSSNKTYYIEKGYEFTNINDRLEVDSYDLPRGSKELVRIKCEQCDEIKEKTRMSIRNPETTCCSTECARTYKKAKEFICPVCHNPFTRSPSNVLKNKNGILYCSYECSTKAIKVRDESKWTHNQCIQCNKKYEILRSKLEIYGSKFCSNPCRNKWESINKRGDRHHLFKAEIIPCTNCGKENKVIQSNLTRYENHFCGAICRQHWYSEVWSQSIEWRDESRIRAVNILSSGVISNTNSNIQQIINSSLYSMGIDFVNEYDCKYYSVDNYLPDYNLMIEVMGEFWHADPRKYHTLDYEIQKKRVKSDKAKKSYIKNKYSLNILYLWERDIIDNADLCEKLVSMYIDSNGVLANYHSFNYFMHEDEVYLSENILIPYFEAG